MGKTATTWQVMKDSWGVLMRDKELLIFPVATGVASLLVLLTFIVPLVIAAVAGHGTHGAGLYAVLFAYWVCGSFVAIFLNAALVHHVLTRLRGGQPTLGESFRAAMQCLPEIAVWALITSTVGVVLRMVAERGGWIGGLFAIVLGVAFGLVSYFVVPIVIMERKGAFEAIGASKDLLFATWGKQIASGLAYGLIGFLLSLPGYVVIMLAFVAGLALRSWAAFGAIFAGAVLYLVGLAIVLATLRAIFGAVLYEYVHTGQVPAGFDDATLRRAVVPQPA